MGLAQLPGDLPQILLVDAPNFGQFPEEILALGISFYLG
jgi:hypothetical protein